MPDPQVSEGEQDEYDFDFSVELAMPAQSPAKPCCALAWPGSCCAAGMWCLALPLLSSVLASSPASACSTGCVPIRHAAPPGHWGRESHGVVV